uniref:Uncharacterized protein n=1 Tax=Rhizophora mucronata TaxID=61149 RepID=A0A2P2IJH5_RHIMU
MLIMQSQWLHTIELSNNTMNWTEKYL